MRTCEKPVFTLAWEFPPIISGESLVCLKSLKYSRLCYDVCCGSSSEEGSEPLPEHIKVYPQEGKYLLWPLGAVRLFKRLDKEKDYQVMMSRVMPPNGHLAGLLIKLLKPRIKWVVYFSDPVWNSPFIRFPFIWRKDNTHRPSYWLLKLYGIPARLALKKSDLLVFNNERLARYVTGKSYEKYINKICIAPYGHEGVWQRPPRRTDGSFILAHVGQVYGNRTLKPLVEAVELLREKHPALFHQLNVRQVGFLCKAEEERIRRSPASSAFQTVGQVPYEDSLEEMYRADCLLVIDPVFDHSTKNIYVPAKLYDYMSTGKPILAIADENSATADIMSELDGRCVCHEAETVCDILVQVLSGEPMPPNLEKYKVFHCSCGAEKLDTSIANLNR